MKLYFMKQEALDWLKANLKTCYTNYYVNETGSWVNDLYGDDAFEFFMEIPDFALTPIDDTRTKGDIDLNNCKIMYSKLNFLSESQAADERLWAGLCHTVFYEYMRKKWEMNDKTKKIPDVKKAVGQIRTRFLFEGSTKAGFYRNTLSKCWWVGSKTYDANNDNHFAKLDALGSNDIVSKISEIFYSYNFSSNPTVLAGICKAFQHFKDEGIYVSVRNHLRPSVQLLNAVGGGVILDCLSEDEIADIVIANIDNIRAGKGTGIDTDTHAVEGAEEEEIKDEPSKNDQGSTTDVNVLEVVALNTDVYLHEATTGETKHFQIKDIKIAVQKSMLGKKIGDEVEIKGKKYIIDRITLM